MDGQLNMKVYLKDNNVLVFEYSNIVVKIVETTYPHIREIHAVANIDKFDVGTYFGWLLEFESLKKKLYDEYNVKVVISETTSDNKKVIKFWRMFGFNILDNGNRATCYMYLGD